MNITLLTQKTDWYGKHSGYYEQISSMVNSRFPDSRIITPKRSIFERIIGKSFSVVHSMPPRNQSVSASEFRFHLDLVFRSGHRIFHILDLENHSSYIQNLSHKRKHLIATIHFPPSAWNPEQLKCLRNIGECIVLYKKDINFFENYSGSSNVHFIRHGVDIDFFKPLVNKIHTPKRVLVIGQFLRDFTTLKRIIIDLHKQRKDIEFHLVIAEHARSNPDLISIQDHPKTRWYKNISDEELRELYQRSTVLLLPMIDSGANNAITEALACGLPIVTNTIGGIADYGGGTVFPTCSTGDDQALVELTLSYLDKPSLHKDVSDQSRDFAVRYLGWNDIFEQHVQLYEKILTR